MPLPKIAPRCAEMVELGSTFLRGCPTWLASGWNFGRQWPLPAAGCWQWAIADMASAKGAGGLVLDVNVGSGAFMKGGGPLVWVSASAWPAPGSLSRFHDQLF
jgi:hypothetical protein